MNDINNTDSNMEKETESEIDYALYEKWFSYLSFRDFTMATFVNILVGMIFGSAANIVLAIMWLAMIFVLARINDRSVKNARNYKELPSFVNDNFAISKNKTVILGYLITAVSQAFARLQSGMDWLTKTMSILMVIVLIAVYLGIFWFFIHNGKNDSSDSN